MVNKYVFRVSSKINHFYILDTRKHDVFIPQSKYFLYFGHFNNEKATLTTRYLSSVTDSLLEREQVCSDENAVNVRGDGGHLSHHSHLLCAFLRQN